MCFFFKYLKTRFINYVKILRLLTKPYEDLTNTNSKASPFFSEVAQSHCISTNYCLGKAHSLRCPTAYNAQPLLRECVWVCARDDLKPQWFSAHSFAHPRPQSALHRRQLASCEWYLHSVRHILAHNKDASCDWLSLARLVLFSLQPEHGSRGGRQSTVL